MKYPVYLFSALLMINSSEATCPVSLGGITPNTTQSFMLSFFHDYFYLIQGMELRNQNTLMTLTDYRHILTLLIALEAFPLLVKYEGITSSVTPMDLVLWGRVLRRLYDHLQATPDKRTPVTIGPDSAVAIQRILAVETPFWTGMSATDIGRFILETVAPRIKSFNSSHNIYQKLDPLLAGKLPDYDPNAYPQVATAYGQCQTIDDVTRRAECIRSLKIDGASTFDRGAPLTSFGREFAMLRGDDFINATTKILLE